MKYILALALLLFTVGTTSFALAQRSNNSQNKPIQELADRGDLLSRDTLYRIIDPETKNVIYILTSSVPGAPDQMEVVPAGLSGK